MSRKAMILKRLYESGKINAEGLRRAAADGVITEAEYALITEEGSV